MYRELHQVHIKYYNIGLELGVSSDTLDGIRSQFGSPEDALREVLKQWLKQTISKPTWQAAIKALRSRIVGETKLADELAAKYCSKSTADMTTGKRMKECLK